jgi:hypothetical protein
VLRNQRQLGEGDAEIAGTPRGQSLQRPAGHCEQTDTKSQTKLTDRQPRPEYQSTFTAVAAPTGTRTINPAAGREGTSTAMVITNASHHRFVTGAASSPSVGTGPSHASGRTVATSCVTMAIAPLTTDG